MTMKKIVSSIGSANTIAKEIRQDCLDLITKLADLNEYALLPGVQGSSLLVGICEINKAVLRMHGDLGYVVEYSTSAHAMAMETEEMVSGRERLESFAVRLRGAISSVGGLEEGKVPALCKAAGIQQATLESWLSGQRQPRPHTLKKVNDVLEGWGVSPVIP